MHIKSFSTSTISKEFKRDVCLPALTTQIIPHTIFANYHQLAAALLLDYSLPVPIRKEKQKLSLAQTYGQSTVIQERNISKGLKFSALSPAQ